MLKNKITHALFTLAALAATLTANAQADSIRLGNGIKMKLGGFVRGDYLIDSRQTEGAIDGLFTYYPLPKALDANGNDLNATPKASLYALSSRFGASLFGPEVLRAKTSAALEFDFTGTTNVSGVRLRQAWMKLAWAKTDLLIGRTWHPMTAACMPSVISLATGAPFAAFNRSEQIRFGYRFSSMQLSLAALFRNAEYMRSSLTPELNMQLSYVKNGLSFGALANYLSIKPKTFTQVASSKYKTEERVNALSAQLFFSLQRKNLSVKASSIYGELLNDLSMMGGYAVYNIDPATGAEKYTPSKNINAWVNVVYGEQWKLGILLGYLKNMGYNENPVAMYGRGFNVDYAYRIAPSLTYSIKQIQLGCELEYTAAAYGDADLADKGKIKNSSTVGNTRVNAVAAFYF